MVSHLSGGFVVIKLLGVVVSLCKQFGSRGLHFSNGTRIVGGGQFLSYFPGVHFDGGTSTISS